VTNNFKKELNVKIQGAGVGGCDVVLASGEVDESCWCLWGTLHYSFCAYEKKPLGADTNATLAEDASEVGSGKCPKVTGENLVCSDLSSLGNCYDKAYTCSVDQEGLCHCSTV